MKRIQTPKQVLDYFRHDMFFVLVLNYNPIPYHTNFATSTHKLA
jgi:hypothetical protein